MKDFDINILSLRDKVVEFRRFILRISAKSAGKKEYINATDCTNSHRLYAQI